ncbi:RNA polymerase sigma factor [Ruminococcus flavefaciens]|uniref:RNA polymerase sigma-70 factor (ECF subfamily) n=1 Tax=Ruminococcus flavefaciens TaxID=1265 RepID=A0A315XWM4_RUMFL|nr:RNA polymerase sigma factor [Ruminococcus flavefaciens]PWJ11624.1 RNA polymerase sigma-70 factor (ECF subfamily) [Ruminococcus flavefaciens]SSA50533.1 RNA polymerase sigma-70 factor, ECF subfamily [Ruminococcus flavefaciens]
MQKCGCAREAVEKYGDMLYRISLLILKNTADAEDAVQETFIKYFTKAPEFTDAEHEKAWLITVATNRCRDMLRYRSRHETESEEVLNTYAVEKSDSGILEALMELNDKYRIIMILFYVEQYKIDEIADITGVSVSAVKMRLSRGRKLLEEKYRKEYM